MKIHLNTPQNPDAFSANVTTWRVAKSFQLIGTVLGIVTEYAVLYAAIVAHAIMFFPAANWVEYAAISLTIGIVLALARERLRTGKQAAKIMVDKNARKLGAAANTAIMVSCVIVFGASIALSWLGAAQGVGAILPVPELAQTGTADSAYLTLKADAERTYRADSAMIAKTYAQKITATKQKYNAEIAPLQKRQKAATKKEDKNWLQTKINPLISERDAAVNEIIAEKSEQLIALNTAKQAQINTYHLQTTNNKQTYLTQHANRQNRNAWFAGMADQMIPWVIVSALFLLLVGLYLEEQFKKAAGIKEVVLPNKYDLAPGFLTEAGETVGIVLNSWGRSLLNGVSALQTKPTIKQMDDLIELKLNEYRKTVLEIGNDAKTRTPIGFKTPDNTKTDTPEAPEAPEKPGKHLKRLFGKRGVGEMAEIPDPKNLITLDFAARQAATYKSLAKKGLRNPERTAALARYWEHIRNDMHHRGVIEILKPEFKQEDWA